MNKRPWIGVNTVALLQRGLLIFLVVIYFCNIGIYLSLEVSPKIEPQYWLAALIICGLILGIHSKPKIASLIDLPLFVWCISFISLTLILYIGVENSHFQQLKERVRDVTLMMSLSFILLILAKQLKFVRQVLLVAVLLGITINLISVVHSNFLLPNLYEYAARPAGFYINPNESATAILFGMILTITLLPKQFRISYAALAFVGIVATFSREAVLAWLLVASILCAFRIIEWKKLVLWTFIAITAALSLAYLLVKLKLINYYVAEYYHYNLERLIWFIHGVQHDPSAQIRLTLIKSSIDLFLQHPWIGNGIGSTEHWSHNYSTHNMYLYYMDDYGVVGLLLFPLIVWCMFYESVGQVRKIGWCLAISLLFWGLFDHDVMRNYYSLFSISMMAAMSRQSKIEQRNEMESRHVINRD